jgi:hypothetical protein
MDDVSEVDDHPTGDNVAIPAGWTFFGQPGQEPALGLRNYRSGATGTDQLLLCPPVRRPGTASLPGTTHAGTAGAGPYDR